MLMVEIPWRNAPFFTNSSRLRCVATMTRTFTGIERSPPTRSTCPSSRTRSSSLHLQRHVADFLQEKRAPIGLLEASDVPRRSR